MPPPHLSHSLRHLASRALRLSPRLFVCASALVLAGCATPPRTALNSESSSSLHTLRDNYLSQTKSDPLGAYLTQDNDDIAIDYPSSNVAGADKGMSSSPKTIVAAAMQFLGVKYRFGGGSPSTGFDCSGLVAYAAETSLGLKLPRSARDIASQGESVGRGELRKGDLVFFNTRGHRFSHVGIYLGNRQFVHAPRTGAKVRVENMDIAYWTKRYNGARRLHPDTTARTALRK